MNPVSRVVWPRSDESGDVRVVVGDEAHALLGHPAFIAAWEALERECPWTTPFQRAAFSKAWYSTYADVAVPVLVLRATAEGLLRGIFPLASFDEGQRLTASGAEQAEYQGWLALPAEDDFIVAGLDRLGELLPVSRLRLQYLPPGIPLARLDRDPRWGRRLLRRTESRGLMRLDPAETARTLKKSGNRSKMNRLKQLGEVRLDRLTSRKDLEEVIDEIGAHCDVRQCAMNGVMPFRDDTRKKEFYLRLLAQPGLLHATVLRVGNLVAAAHLGVASERDVALGVIAHSPFLAAHSPGKLLLYLLSDRLAAERFEYLDLTPGGAYKDRFASHADEVEIREIYFRPRAYLKASILVRTRRTARRVALAAGRAIGLDESKVLEHGRRLKARLSLGSLRHAPRTVVTALSSRWPGRHESLFYRISAADVRNFDPVTTFTRDSVEHLKQYEPAGPADPDRQAFCRLAIERLEAGQHAYTFVENGQLRHVAWLIARQEQAASAWGQPYTLEPQSAVLYDDYTHPSARRRGLQRQSIVQRAKDAVTTWSADWVYSSVLGHNGSWRRNLERLGFALTAAFAREVPSGREHRS